jgi:hypothetical protein
MHARDPAEAVEVLNLLLNFFGDGERWIKGRLSDRRGKCCLVGALEFVSSHHAIKGEAAERYLAAAISEVRERRIRRHETGEDYARLRASLRRAIRGDGYRASETLPRRDSLSILTMGARTSPSCGRSLWRRARRRWAMPSPGGRRARVSASSATSWLWPRGTADAGRWFFRSDSAALRSGFRMRHVTPHVPRRLVLAQPFIDDLAQEIILRPGQELDLGDQLRPHPMDPRQNQRRAEPGRARRRHVEQHLGDGERLQPPPQPFKLGWLMPVPTRPA